MRMTTCELNLKPHIKESCVDVIETMAGGATSALVMLVVFTYGDSNGNPFYMDMILSSCTFRICPYSLPPKYVHFFEGTTKEGDLCIFAIISIMREVEVTK